jgi:hypothetical protein
VEATSGDATQTDSRDVMTERSSADEAPKNELLPAKLVDLPGRPAKGEDEPGPQQPPEEGKDKCPP